MRSIRCLVSVAGVILAIVGCTSVSPAPSHQAFHLDKTCVAKVVCTVSTSNATLIPPGTLINYAEVGDGSAHLSNATIVLKNGSATGICDFNFLNDPLVAKCTFTKGTGALTGFHLAADVTLTGDGQTEASVWHWDGSYWFGD